jgi:hypothetical protein
MTGSVTWFLWVCFRTEFNGYALGMEFGRWMKMHGMNVSRTRLYDITSANVPNNPNSPIPRHSKIIVLVRYIKLLPFVAAYPVSFACVRSFIIYYLVYDLYRATFS